VAGGGCVFRVAALWPPVGAALLLGHAPPRQPSSVCHSTAAPYAWQRSPAAQRATGAAAALEGKMCIISPSVIINSYFPASEICVISRILTLFKGRQLHMYCFKH